MCRHTVCNKFQLRNILVLFRKQPFGFNTLVSRCMSPDTVTKSSIFLRIFPQRRFFLKHKYPLPKNSKGISKRMREALAVSLSSVTIGASSSVIVSPVPPMATLEERFPKKYRGTTQPRYHFFVKLFTSTSNLRLLI